MSLSSHTVTYSFLVGIVLLLFLCFTPPAAAQSPTINYQGKLASSTGATVANGLYDMEFSLYTTPTGDTDVWTETLTGANAVQVTNGLFSIMLGSTTPFTNVDFTETLYLGVTVGADTEMTPRKLLGTVPASLYIDGQHQNTEESADTMPTGDIFRIGTYSTSPTEFYNSAFDDFHPTTAHPPHKRFSNSIILDNLELV